MPLREAEPRYVEPLLGIVFDLDGTLVLSHHDFGRMRKTVVSLAEKYGVVPGHLSVADPIHRIVENAREELRNAGVPDGQFYRFEAEYRKSLDRIELEALPRTTARPGADALLQSLAARGLRLGLLTRSSEAFARGALQQTGLATYFSYLRTRSAPGPAKPNPESLRGLLREMGVPLDRALFVGDHLIDAECATAAGVRFYAVLPDPSEAAGSTQSKDRFLAGGASAVAVDLPTLARQLDISAPRTPTFA
jgi:HAD superfamily hydrolase (TIGR01549 family)